MKNPENLLDTQPLEARIHEAEGQTSNGGHVVEVTIIKAGTSANGNHYPSDLLQNSAQLFEGARAFADHPGPIDRKERSIRDLVGHYRNPRYELGPSGARIRADLHLLPGNDWLWGIIQEASGGQAPAMAGLSVDALGEVQSSEVAGHRVRMVKAFKKVNSVDLVTKPAAGGELERIMASEGDAGNAIADERPVMENDGSSFSADERKQFATVIRHHPDGSAEYKFPIPPKGHPAAQSHAQNALARLDQSDLTPEEKAHVTARAHAVLGTATKESDMTQSASSTTEDPNLQNQTAASPTPSSPPQEGQTAQLREGSSTPSAAQQATPPASPAQDLPTQLRALQLDKEKAERELSQIKEALAPDHPAEPTDPGASALNLLEQIKKDRESEKCARVLEQNLRESHLPEPVQARLRRRYDGKIFSVVQLQEDIGDERDVLGQLSGSGQILGHGYEKPLTLGMSEYEQLQAAFDKMFDVTDQLSEAQKSVPSFDGLRSAFRIATGRDIATIGGADLPLQESYQDSLRHYVRAKIEAGTLRESEYLLRETDVTTSSFSYLLGTSMNKRLLKDYQAWPSEWQKFANTVAVKDFKTQDRIRLGAFGSLSAVSEDAAYTTLTLADTHATYTPSKVGNLVQISRETIINDDLYAIKQIPQKLAVAAAFTLAEFVYGLLAPDFGNIYDSHSLFDATNHKNTGVTSGNIGTKNSGTALSSAAMQTATIAMRKQQNAASKPIGLKPRFLLVPPDLEFVAMTILKSAGLPGGSNNDINPMMGFAEPIVSPQLSTFLTNSVTTAIVIADPRVIDTLEVGFVGGQVNPVLFIQDQPLYGLNFTYDVISYKVRHEYGGAVVDYRGFYLINN